MPLSKFCQASGIDVKGDDRSMLTEGDCDGESNVAKPSDRDSFWIQGDCQKRGEILVRILNMRWIYQNSYLGFYIIYHLFKSGDLPSSDTLEKPLTVKLSFLVCHFTVPDELDRKSKVL